MYSTCLAFRTGRESPIWFDGSKDNGSVDFLDIKQAAVKRDLYGGAVVEWLFIIGRNLINNRW